MDISKTDELVPMMGNKDIKLFYKYLDKATHYFEFGSGGSTYQSSLRDNIKSITSIESDREWFTFIDNKKISKLNLIYNDLEAETDNYGYPGSDCSQQKMINYSSQILYVKQKPDLILVDGRFRVACALKSFYIDDCFIALDDFLDRPDYHILLEFFDIVNKSNEGDIYSEEVLQDSREPNWNHMVILKKKKKEAPPLSLINKYELISD